MSVQGRKVCRRTRRDWEHEAKIEGVGMIIIVDPADWCLKSDIRRVRVLR